MNIEYKLQGHTKRLPGFDYIGGKNMLDDYEMLNPEEFLAIWEPSHDGEW